MGTVIREKNTSAMPFYTSLATFFNALTWTAYGWLVWRARLLTRPALAADARDRSRTTGSSRRPTCLGSWPAPCRWVCSPCTESTTRPRPRMTTCSEGRSPAVGFAAVANCCAAWHACSQQEFGQKGSGTTVDRSTTQGSMVNGAADTGSAGPPQPASPAGPHGPRGPAHAHPLGPRFVLRSCRTQTRAKCEKRNWLRRFARVYL
jgi:hypothetical protein